MKRVGSTAFSACLRAHAYVDGDSTLRRSIISKKDPSEKSKDALETSRRKEARRAATCARSMWVLLHFLLIYVCATHGTEFQKALKEGWLGYLMTLFGLLGLNVLLYLATSMRDPGFQEMRDVGLCAGEGDRPSNSHCAVAGSDTLEGRSTDWLRSSEPSSTPTSPSGEASTSLAAASLAGIRPPHSPTAEEAAALALTTNSNHIGNGNGTATSRPRLRSGCTAPATVTPGAQADETYVAIDLPPSSATDTPHGRTCPYCQAWQPLRTKHCHDCDRCVRRFDHHCVWVGNCIGSRNYRLFYAYLLTQLSCLVWGLRILLSGFRPIRSYYTRAFRLPGRSHSPVDTWVTDHLPHIGGILLLGTLIIFVGSLILFHTYLIATDQTNYEMLQLAGGGVYYLRDVPEGIAPFSRGPAANCKNFLCQGERWGEVHVMPPVEEMRFSAAQGTIWSNKHYSCFD